MILAGLSRFKVNSFNINQSGCIHIGDDGGIMSVNTCFMAAATVGRPLYSMLKSPKFKV